MTTDRDQLRTAVHEASHAVCAALMGCVVGSISLSGRHATWRGSALYYEPARLAVSVAGYVGERIAGLSNRTFQVIDWDPSCNWDGAKVGELLLGAEDATRILQEMMAFVERCLRREWAAVSLLARLVVVRGELEEPDIAPLLPLPLSEAEMAEGQFWPAPKADVTCAVTT
jgi:hypothetical protein